MVQGIPGEFCPVPPGIERLLPVFPSLHGPARDIKLFWKLRSSGRALWDGQHFTQGYLSLSVLPELPIQVGLSGACLNVGRDCSPD